MDNPFQSPAILSLCTGMRGLERGIERVIGDTRAVAYVEIEAFIIENLVQQMEKGVLAPTPVWSNLKTFDWKAFHGKVHGIIGGYPCQPFSVAGQQRGTEDPRHLWPYIKEGIQSIRPVWCFFENVPGHINIGYREVRSDLEGLGYTVKEGIFSAEEVGATHQRKRLFILAISKCMRKQPLISNSSNLGNTSGQGLQKCRHGRIGQHEEENREGMDDRLKQSSSNVEYSISQRRDNEQEGCIKTRTDEVGKLPTSEQSRNDIKCGTIKLSTDVANSESNGIRGLSECEPRQERSISINSFHIDGESKTTKWPSRPGEPQNSWEPPRTKPRLGFMLNGYSFREDLLRMAGNGVVEQTAELAFRTLLNKYLHKE